MVVDYRERKPVSKNRPKPKPFGMLALAFFLTAGVSFGLGVLTDRFLLPPRGQKTAATPAQQPATPPQPAARQAAAPSTQPGTTTPPPPAEPSFTFYETLPKGGNAILGSGINPKKQEAVSAPSAKAAPAAAPPKTENPSHPQKAAKPEVTVKGEEAQAKKTGAEKPASERPEGDAGRDASTKKPPAQKGKFSVQVASAKDRKEAEAIKTKLAEKGVAAYIVESAVPGKGTWYRIKVGKQMDESAAGDMASRLGKGAIVIPE